MDRSFLPYGLDTSVVDPAVRARAAEHLRRRGVWLPAFAELADPFSIPARTREALGGVDPDEPHPLNLFRVHWYNRDRRVAPVPAHLLLREPFTGVATPIIVALGDRFPLIRAHKVLAAYACLVPRLVTGQFDPARDRAVWPSTGNYCRGGVAISRMLGCRSVAILPEGMSEERFRWLDAWVDDPADIVRTPGTESNVKEIYDACAELARDPRNVVLNQFCEFGNHLVHYACTGPALAHLFEHVAGSRPDLRLRAFVAATGSAGTLAAGDYLKERFGSCVVAAEPLECPTMLENGYGEHNIQGIGDKHIPLIHNVMNTDLVVAVSDRVTDQLNVAFNSPEGRACLRRRGVGEDILAGLGSLGLSSICNVVAAIKVVKRLGLGPTDAIVTVATDGAALYATEREKAMRKHFGGRFDQARAEAVFTDHVLGAGTDHVLELDESGRRRIFNLGYFTWVEQRGVPPAAFEARRDQRFWKGIRDRLQMWDELIAEVNGGA